MSLKSKMDAWGKYNVDVYKYCLACANNICDGSGVDDDCRIIKKTFDYGKCSEFEKIITERERTDSLEKFGQQRLIG